MKRETTESKRVEHLELPGFRSTARLQLPHYWTQGLPSRGRTSISLQMHPIEDVEVAIIAAQRGHELSTEGARKFLAVLSAEPHKLDDLERRRIAEALDEHAVRTRFSIREARTEKWNGKTVLITEGFYAANGDCALTLFVEAAGDGSWVEQFQYTAPEAKFDRYLPEAMGVLRRMQWLA